MVYRARVRVLVLLIIIALLSGAFAAAPASAAASKPNILFILTDDLNLDEISVMPNLKALIADQGTSFDNYFASVSLCCPSRSTTIRGQYSHNTGVETNGGSNGGFETAFRLGIEKSTIATWLKAAGYRTGLFGKYLNGYPNTAPSMYIPPGWDEWNSAIKGDPYSEYNYTLNSDGKAVQYKAKPEDYGTDVYSKEALDFIQKSGKDKVPFFAYLAVYAPHQPATPAPRHKDLFPDVQAPRTPNYNEPDVSDKPGYIADLPLMRPAEQKIVDNLYRRRLQSLQAVDEAIRNLVDGLKANGQLDNTYIVFTSDNGFHLGNHRMPAGKQTAYEEDIHLPLIVRGPGVGANRRVTQMVGNIDLAPTFAAMAGAQAADFVDGRSFLPVLEGKGSDKWRQQYLVEHFIQGASTSVVDPETQEPDDIDQIESTPAPSEPTATPSGKPSRAARLRGIPEFHGIRGPGWVYVEYVTGEKEFYNLASDPYELTNLARRLDPATQKILSDQVKALVDCHGDTCRSVEDQVLAIKVPGMP